MELQKGEGACAADLFGAPRRATVLVNNQILNLCLILNVKEY